MQAAGAVFRLDRLEHDVRRRQPDLLELLGDEEAVPVIAEHGEVAKQIAGEPTASLLEQRLRAGDPVKLLGEGLARQRPQPGAGSAAQDEWRNVPHPFAVARQMFQEPCPTIEDGAPKRILGQSPAKRCAKPSHPLCMGQLAKAKTEGQSANPWQNRFPKP